VLTAEKTIHTDEQLGRQLIASLIAYVALYCEGKAIVYITASDEPGWFLFTFTSAGLKARLISEMDREMFGYIDRVLIEIQNGQVRQAEETDQGAIVRFALPKK
jgi:hypothetical protein